MNKEVDNLKLILPLLTFESEDDFYYLQIIQRKKDQDVSKVRLGRNNNARTIKEYYISSTEYLIDRYDEIKALSKVFNARVGINLNKKSYTKVALKTMSKLVANYEIGHYKACKASYSKACGSSNNASIKKWIIDIDEDISAGNLAALEQDINSCQPNNVTNKIIACIPSKNGLHLITSPFNIKQFKELETCHNVEIHKNNPSNIFIP